MLLSVSPVETNLPDAGSMLDKQNPMCQQIADNVVTFLLQEMAHGRIPPEFLPLQSGVGNINNAVMARLGENPEIPPFMMYSEVLQESVVHLLETGKISGASASSLTISAESLRKIYDNMDYFASRIVLRPQEISNNPEIIRRLGVIALNVGLEFDIYGHANSTHVAGVDLMNGIGGRGDFERNAYLSIFMAPSIAKEGKISTVVPMCSHVDHSEHSVKVIITEQGIADLRVLDYGCTVSSDSLNFTVDLQKNSARQFPTTGSTSPAVPFQITLSECSKGTTGVRVAFNGIEDAENNTLLKLDEGSNTASGLGIEILDGNMRPVKLNDLHAGMQWIPLVPEQNNILPYSARLKSTQKSVNPGLVRASPTFTLEFQ